jgi:mono/diheme cytochrome c family protein
MRTTRLVRCLKPLGMLLALLVLPGFVRAQEQLVYEKQVRSILKLHCFRCHGEEDKPKGKLDLRLVRWMLRGGKTGPALVAGKPAESLMWERIASEEMPPGKKKLSPQERSIIQTWILQGAHTARPEPEQLAAVHQWTDEERQFWSFQPIRRPPVPSADMPAQLKRNPIDAFLLEKLQARKLSFSPEADRHTLIRRLSFDLLGLPPTPEEVEDFVKDARADAYERLVDRLLASPHYGERWARHWLDVAGYADSDGYSAHDAERKYVYKYRDYMIHALNADRPWDELIREQLAGDEMVRPPYANLPPADQDKLIATGFLRLAPDGTAAPDIDQNQARNDVVAETLKIVSTSLLGLSVGCAQCHPHRHDPISQEDYYRQRAIFEPALDWKNWRAPNARLVSLWSEKDLKKVAEVNGEIERLGKERLAALQDLVGRVLEKELAQAPADVRDPLRKAQATPIAARSAEQKQMLLAYPRVSSLSVNTVSLYDQQATQQISDKYQKLTEAAQTKRPPDNYIHALTEASGVVPKTFLFFRGDINQPRQEQPPGELSILADLLGDLQISASKESLPTSGRRLAFARHLTSGKHPLVARVLVNRIWMHHFGRGIVSTPADFGMHGERPSHPELLDYLADEFMRGGWKWKPLHRLIVTSAAYRQSSRRRPEQESVDPDNRLLGRAFVRRLEAEAVRDGILAISGKLNPKAFGPPVSVTLDEVGQIVVGIDTRDAAGVPTGKKVPLGGEEFRRSLYIQVRRSMPLSMLESFDAPMLTPNCELRSISTVAPQALLMMNNDFLVTQSEAFAERVVRTSGNGLSAQVRLAWRLALGREPTAGQLEEALGFLTRQTAHFVSQPTKPGTPAATPSRKALANFCHALLCSNGYLYVD